MSKLSNRKDRVSNDVSAVPHFGGIQERVCKRPTCGHRWYPRSPGHPRMCPKCKSSLWDSEPIPAGGMIPAGLSQLERRLLQTFLDFRRTVEPAVVSILIEQMKLHIRLRQADKT